MLVRHEEVSVEGRPIDILWRCADEFAHGSSGLNVRISFSNCSILSITFVYIFFNFPLSRFASSLSKKSTRSSSMNVASDTYAAARRRRRSLMASFKCFLDSGREERRLNDVVPVGSWNLKCLLASIIASISSFTHQWMTLIDVRV